MNPTPTPSENPPAPSAPVSLVFGKYEVIKRLAIGGMGEIFLARQTGLSGFDRLAILKSLLPDLAEQEGFVDQFLDEARVAATLNHPNIVAIYEVGLWEGTYFIAMEYIRGSSVAQLLSEVVSSKKRLDPNTSARIIHDAALGLEHAHIAKDSKGKPLNIVHRDISPQNIMVRDDGVTKVVDFGIARASNRSTRTATGDLKGKLEYMAPEQIGGKPLDGRSDMFALGVVFWEMCAQRRLFKSDNPMQTMEAIVKKPIAKPSEYRADISPDLEAIILKMLERDVDARYRNLAEAAAAIREYLNKQPKPPAEPDVANVIREFLGEKIEALTKDLTPSQENFVIQLRSGSNVNGSDKTVFLQVPSRKRYVWIGLALIAAATLAAAATRFFAPKPLPAAAPVTIVTPPPPPPKPIEPAIVELTSTPSGATVLLGTQPLGVTPLRLDKLQPDVEHKISFEYRGYNSGEATFTLKAGETKTVDAVLEKKKAEPQNTKKKNVAPPPGSSVGFVTVKTTPWTRVTIDGQSFGSTPLFKVTLPVGNHTIVLFNDQEGVRETRTISIKPGDTTKLDLKLKK